MKIAIMQPYIFPYIGYFQLINAVDKFIFYDDVNYIKRGWINRNQILINGEAKLFTIPVIKASQNKLIKEIDVNLDTKWMKQFLSTLEFNYKKAPYFKETFELVERVLNYNVTAISDMAINSNIVIAEYLNLSTSFEVSSKLYSNTKGMAKADRLIEICKINNAIDYINPSGGNVLYDKEYFLKKGVSLYFIDNKIIPYQQFNNGFVGGLSMIDLLMFNNKNEIREMLNQYQLN